MKFGSLRASQRQENRVSGALVLPHGYKSWVRTEDLENLRRSLAMAAPDEPATALTNGCAARLLAELIDLRAAAAAGVLEAGDGDLEVE